MYHTSRCIKDFGECFLCYVIDIISQTCLLNCTTSFKHVISVRDVNQSKSKGPHYGYIPKDYIPLEHLAVDIKYMPDGFDSFRFLIMVTCEQTNFVFAIPSKNRTARVISDALIHRVFAVSRHPQYLSVNQDTALMGMVIQILLQSLQCCIQIISPWNHGSLKAERQIQTIGNMITIHRQYDY